MMMMMMMMMMSQLGYRQRRVTRLRPTTLYRYVKCPLNRPA